MDGTPPECMYQRQRKARKDHACCECSRTIKAGSTYEFTSGIWDGEPSSHKTCLRCVGLRAAFTAVDESPPFTCLLECIRECVRDEGREWAVWFKNKIREGNQTMNATDYRP
jgi:hypothetical protein